jgi:hypothetical protein
MRTLRPKLMAAIFATVAVAPGSLFAEPSKAPGEDRELPGSAVPFVVQRNTPLTQYPGGQVAGGQIIVRSFTLWPSQRTTPLTQAGGQLTAVGQVSDRSSAPWPSLPAAIQEAPSGTAPGGLTFERDYHRSER